jgi:TolA-binding protein
MKNIALLVFFLIPSITFAQTEEEKRAIMAAKNKIEADSVSLHSRSSRIAEQRRQIEVLEDNLKSVYRTLELLDTLDNVRKSQIKTEVGLRVKAEQEAVKSQEEAEKQKKGKKGWRNTAFGLAVIVAIETAIIVLL